MLAALLLLPALASAHPLDPLEPAELSSAVAVVRAAKSLPEDVFFPYVALKEPPKKAMLAWKPGAALPREALVAVFDRSANAMAEAVVDLGKGELRSWTPRPGAQPNVMLEEFDKFPEVVRADGRWRAAMSKRGLDPDKVWVDLWAPGLLSKDEKASGRRLLRALSYVSEGNKNAYAHPVEGVVAVVDANARKVLEVVDSGVVPVSSAPGDFGAGEGKPGLFPRPVKPFSISQPEGPGFAFEGHQVRWDRWTFRWALHPREGPVLYQVAWNDYSELKSSGAWLVGGRLFGTSRSILYRASLSEMLVPYGDPDPLWSFRNAFDEGEYGIGRMAGPLLPGRDAPDNAVFLDADFADDRGRPYKAERAVALYERDGGILWKHNDLINGRSESRRARELVLTFVATISNYDYQLSWVFRQDGTLKLESALTGIMLAKGVKAQSADELHAEAGGHHAHLVAPGVVAPHHQHFFNFRLDFDVDGPANTVVEADAGPAPAGPENPMGNSILMEETPIRRESEGRRDLSLAKARKWRVRSASAKNGLGEPTAYTLLPAENSVPYLSEASPVRRRGRFIEHALWVTAEDDDELYAAGAYPNQGEEEKGLPEWQAKDRALEGKDVVLWYSFGVTHIPRPEDWPVMPSHQTGFMLVPTGFFSRNPALDVP